MQSPPNKANETQEVSTKSPFLSQEYKKLHVRPWIRFFARYIDIILVSFVTAFILGIFNPSLISDSNLIFGMEILFLWFLIEPIFLSTWGTTLGKWILNIKVRDLNGTKPKFYSAFSRSFWVWLAGFGCGIPIVSLFTLISSYSQLKNTGTTAWDKNNFIVTHCNIGGIRIIVTSSIIILAVALSIYGTIQRQQLYLISNVTNQIQAINKDLPHQIDQETELTSVTLINNIVNYNYKFINKDSSEINIDYINNTIKNTLITQDCNNKYMSELLENGYSVSYNYKDKSGKEIANIKINQNNCRH